MILYCMQAHVCMKYRDPILHASACVHDISLYYIYSCIIVYASACVHDVSLYYILCKRMCAQYIVVLYSMQAHVCMINRCIILHASSYVHDIPIVISSL